MTKATKPTNDKICQAMMRLILLGTVSTILLVACSAEESTRENFGWKYGAPTNQRPVIGQSDSLAVLVGDSVSLSIWGYPEFSTRTAVRPNGTITIPLVGEVVAVGHSRRGLTDYLRSRVTEFVKGDLRLFVEVVTPFPRITVIGMVARPSSFPAPTELPLLEVLSIAGGWTEQSDLRYVTIGRQTIHGNEEAVLEIDIESFLADGNLRGLPLIQPGDVVVVPKKENFARELSDFIRDVVVLVSFLYFVNN